VPARKARTVQESTTVKRVEQTKQGIGDMMGTVRSNILLLLLPLCQCSPQPLCTIATKTSPPTQSRIAAAAEMLLATHRKLWGRHTHCCCCRRTAAAHSQEAVGQIVAGRHHCC
jgi:hypothetical protein